MIGVAGHFQIIVYETLMNSVVHRSKFHFSFQIFKNCVEAFDLFCVFREDKILVSLFSVGFQIGNQQFEIFIERWLRPSMKGNGLRIFQKRFIAITNPMSFTQNTVLVGRICVKGILNSLPK